MSNDRNQLDIDRWDEFLSGEENKKILENGEAYYFIHGKYRGSMFKTKRYQTNALNFLRLTDEKSYTNQLFIKNLLNQNRKIFLEKDIEISFEEHFQAKQSVTYMYLRLYLGLI